MAKCNSRAKAIKAKTIELMAINMKAAVGTGRKNNSNCSPIIFSVPLLIFAALLIIDKVVLVSSHGFR
jgi:hypothetical protein